jgi:acetyltransferase-like isoleucine patch superfamily enzyme
MEDWLRSKLKKIVPFPLWLGLARLRSICSPAHVLGRFASGGLVAYISMRASARRWPHVQVGRASIVERGVHLHSNDTGKGKRIIIDKQCFIGHHCFFSAGELIHIQQDCVIGASCHLLAAGHVYDQPTRPYARSAVTSYGKMIIGPNTWVGVGSTLLGGLQVGFGSIIAAGTLLRFSVPPLCLVAGNPARVIKVFDWCKKEWVKLPFEEVLHEAALAHHVRSSPSMHEFLSQFEA